MSHQTRFKVKVDFEVIVEGEYNGIPPELEAITWSGMVARGLEVEEYHKPGTFQILGVIPGDRNMKWLGTEKVSDDE